MHRWPYLYNLIILTLDFRKKFTNIKQLSKQEDTWHCLWLRLLLFKSVLCVKV